MVSRRCSFCNTVYQQITWCETCYVRCPEHDLYHPKSQSCDRCKYNYCLDHDEKYSKEDPWCQHCEEERNIELLLGPLHQRHPDVSTLRSPVKGSINWMLVADPQLLAVSLGVQNSKPKMNKAGHSSHFNGQNLTKEGSFAPNVTNKPLIFPLRLNGAIKKPREPVYEKIVLSN